MKSKTIILINLVLALLMVFSSMSFALTSVPVKSISLNKTSLSLAVGKAATLTALISPKNATNKVIIWSSSDNKIAKVNAKGVVTAVKAGKATITAKSENSKAIAKCVVTISKVAKKVVIFNNFGFCFNQERPQSSEKSYNAVKNKILKETGIEVVTIVPSRDTAQEKLNLKLASDDEIGIFGGDFRQYQSQGVLAPLKKLLDKYGPNIKKNWKNEWKESWNVVSRDGEIWSIPTLPALFERPVWIRSDWLKKIGKEMPKTLDEYEAVLKAFMKADPAGNGETIPLLTASWRQLAEGLAAGFMDIGFGDYKDKDGKIKPIVCHPQFKNFVTRMADWYKKGYIYKETYALSTDKVRELVRTNKVATAVLNTTSITTPLYPLQQAFPGADYQVDDKLMGPKGAIGTCSDVSTGGILISSKASNPEAAMQYIDWTQASVSNYVTTIYGVEGKDWKYVDLKNHSVERINQDFIGEFSVLTFAFTIQFMPSDPASKPEFDYYMKYVTDLGRLKKPFDYGKKCRYNMDEINEKLPNMADIDRMIDEEIVKFLMGERPMNDYDNFIKQLYDAGLDDWSKVMTDQYNKVK